MVLVNVRPGQFRFRREMGSSLTNVQSDGGERIVKLGTHEEVSIAMLDPGFFDVNRARVELFWIGKHPA